MNDNFNKAAAAQKPKPGELVAAVDTDTVEFWIHVRKNRAAVEQEYIAKVLDLLERGADINDRNRKGDTALIWAAQLGFAELARLLMDKGAALDVRNAFGQGYKAISYAVMSCSTEVVRLLLEEGADPDVENIYGGTLVPMSDRSIATEHEREAAKAISKMLKQAPDIRRHALEEKARIAHESECAAQHDTSARRQEGLRERARKAKPHFPPEGAA